MPSTYTVNLGIEKPATGEQSGTWGETVNDNSNILDEAINGVVTITLSSAGSSGSPNTIAITNGASSTGRNKYIEFADGGDLSAAAYVQLTPNDAEKICFIRNSLTASRSIFLFQGTYSTSNDIEIIAGTDVLVKFNGGGTGATVVNVYANLAVDGLDVAGLVEFNSLSGTGSVAITDILDQDNMSGNSATALATQQSIKAYVDAQVDTADTLAEILAIGNTSGGTGLTMSSGDDLNLTGANYNALWDSSESIFYFTDNAKATFGTGADLLIYHDGSNSYVNENGTGKLILATNGAQIDITGSSETMATFVDDGAVSLYFNNAVKIATTSGGVDVTGLVEFDSLSGTGSVAITDILDQDNMSSNSATALATQQSIKAYVDAQVDTADTLSEILAIGNTTGGTDVAVSTDDKVQFRDAAIYINSSTDGQLDIVADTEIQIAATTIDINGAINASGEIIAASLDISGDVDIDGTTNLDIVDIDGAVNIAAASTMLGTLTVGVNDTGHDVKFFGATSGKYMQWDESADSLLVAGTIDVAGAIEFDSLSGTGAVAITDILDQDDLSGNSATALATQQSIKAYVDANTGGNLSEVLTNGNRTTTTQKIEFRDAAIYINSSTDGQLDIVADTEIQIAATTIDINGAVNASGEIIAASLDISGNIDVDGITNLDAVDIDGAVQIDATLSVGVDDTGYDVKFFGATSGKSLLWDESADSLIVTGTLDVAGAIEFNSLSGTGSVTITDILDQDDMSTNSATMLATQQSIKAYVDSNAGVPTGSEITWATATLPTGWLEENGAAISRSTYSALFAVIGTEYGVGDGSSTFNLPDARGEFIRGWDHGAGTDPDAAARTNRGDGTAGDVIGSKQLDQFQGHIFSVRGNNNNGGDPQDSNIIFHIAGSALNNLNSITTGAQSDGTNGTPRTGEETRARNTYRMIIIKY